MFTRTALLLLLLMLFLLACQTTTNAVPTMVPTLVFGGGDETGSELAAGQPDSEIPVAELEDAPFIPAEPLSLGWPEAGTLLAAGRQILVGGHGRPETGGAFIAQIVAGDGRLLVEVPAVVEDLAWQAVVSIPYSPTGPVTIRALHLDSEGELVSSEERAVALVTDIENSDRYLTLSHPTTNQTTVAGHYLFFDGQALLPNGLVTVGVLADDCQRMVSKQSFNLEGSGYWQGFLTLPPELTGDVCAVAYTSQRWDSVSREVLVPLQVLAPQDAAARGMIISTPQPGSTYVAGRRMAAYGVALNPVDGRVDLTVVTEDGRLLTQERLEAQRSGYWETELILPLDLVGPAQVVVSTGRPGDRHYSSTELLIEILSPDNS